MTILSAPALTPAPGAPVPAPPDGDKALSWKPGAKSALGMLKGIGWGLSGIGVIAFGLSYWFVALAALPVFGVFAYVVPVLLDLNIGTAAALGIVLELNGLSGRFPRLFSRLLIAATVYANVADAHSTYARVMHGLPPVVWAVLVAIAEGAIRRIVGLSDETRIQALRKVLWLLKPFSTFRVWRAMRVHELTTYKEGRDYLARRTAARGLMAEWHGRAWKRRAPSAQVLAVKLAEATARPVAELVSAASKDITAAAAAAGRPIGADGKKAEPGPEKAKARPRKRPSRGQDSAAKVAAVAAEFPDATTAELAERLKLAPRTVRRYLALAQGQPGASGA